MFRLRTSVSGLLALLGLAAAAVCAQSVAPVAASTAPALPYAAAVAARFPAPAVVYSTPGLQPGRQTLDRQRRAGGCLAHPGRCRRGTAAGPRAHRQPAANCWRCTSVAAPGGRWPCSLASSMATNRPAARPCSRWRCNWPTRRTRCQRCWTISTCCSGRASTPTARRWIGAAMPPGWTSTATTCCCARARRMRWRGWWRALQPLLFVDVHEHLALGRHMPQLRRHQAHDLLIQYATTANLPPALTCSPSAISASPCCVRWTPPASATTGTTPTRATRSCGG
jgi:hypothetical protein